MGQTKNIFSVDHKIRDLRCKTISVLIFTSNNFRLSFLTRTRSNKCSPSSVTPSSTISLTPNAQDPFFQITPSISPIYELIYEPTNRSSTQSLRSTDLRTHEPELSTSSATQSLRAMKPRTQEPIFDFAGKPRAQITHEPRAFDPEPEPSTHRSSTQSLRPTSLRLRRRLRAFDFAKNPRTDLSLCDFDFCVILIFLVVVVVWVVVFWWFL